ncbi:hypothetical protein PGTUg99_030406 [Puccinia graminis f. sp. tritici]|uniref:Uncharacterized protein n=1 Tax=Puccinia graminis f. sp. tritici TaxID=56615 RepID=A0A5B0S0Q2_PUCGR|nr:hypothetical protein PGTUg99_030406 [Puccinia graminis f. sp. tritici]
MPNWFGNCIVRALAKTYQPCHRCDRARSAISVPSPRHTSSSPWYGSDLTGSYLLPSAHVSGPRYCHRRFLCLEFKQPPPNLDFDLVTRPTRHFVDPFSTVNPTSFDPPISQPLRASISVLMSSLAQWKPPWVGIVPAEIFVPALLSGIKTGLASSLSFLPHQLTSSSFNAINNRFPTFNLTSHYHTACSSLTTPYPTTITNPSSSLTASIMSSIFDNCDTNDFYCEGRSDPSIDIGVRYYPDRDQWSPVFNPNVVPNDDAVGDQAPTNPVSDKDPVDVKPTVDAKEKGPAEATVDPASINTILPSELACSASLVYIPKGMEIVETRTHYFPLKDKWRAINDPSRRYDCPHPFVCVPWSVHDPELPPGLPFPFLRNLNPSVPAPSQPPSTSSSDSSSNDSASSSTYPLISNYINLNHQAVQKLLLDDNTPPAAVCIYTEEDVMHIFEGIAPEYVDMCSEYPPSSLAESDRRVMFFENMQWFFRNKRSTYLSTRKF